MLTMRSATTVAVLILTHGILCSSSFLPSDFSLWQWQTSIVVDHWLYIIGGEYYLLGSTVDYQPSVLSVDLSQSWTTANVAANNITLPDASSVATRRPVVWYDPKVNTVFVWGGWIYDTEPYQLWAFTPDGAGGGGWNTDALPASNGGVALTPTFASAFTSSPSNFYSLGGVQSPTETNPNLPLEGLAIFNFASATWKNATTTNASTQGFLVESQMTFIPSFGTAGVLVAVGGIFPHNQTYDYGSGADLVEMSDVAIYDVGSDTWYHQGTTGPTPPPRRDFCLTGASSKDNASYEIFVFAGATSGDYDLANPSDPGYLDIYVLSLPAFTWVIADVTTQQRRAYHFCQVIGNRQMLAIGGSDPSASSWNTLKDPWTNGLNVFDMTNWTWTAQYDANAASYERATAIDQLYATNHSSPVWSNTALETIFHTQNQSEPTPSPTPNTNHSHAGAIAGGVVGGVLAFIILLGAIFWFRRRQRRRGMEQGMPIPMHEPSEEYKRDAGQGNEYLHEMGEGPNHWPAASHELDVPPAELPANGPKPQNTHLGGSSPDTGRPLSSRDGSPM